MMVARLSIMASALAASSLLPATAAVGDSCRLCEPQKESDAQPEKHEIPVSIDITTRLSFSRTALAGDGRSGQITVSPQNGGALVQGGLVDMGGFSLAGTAIVRGEPGRQIRVDLPRSIRMTSPTGGVITLTDLQTNLSPAPRLDTAGVLTFSFGGALQVDGRVSGKFRGRIPITAQYE